MIKAEAKVCVNFTQRFFYPYLYLFVVVVIFWGKYFDSYLTCAVFLDHLDHFPTIFNTELELND